MTYLQGAKNYMLMFRWTHNLEATNYSDLDFIGYVDSCKSTSEYIFIMVSRVISWRSVKQNFTTTFIIKAEFVSCFKATTYDMYG
jgi:hypothetical protein